VQIQVVDPSTLVATEEDRQVFLPLKGVLDEAAEGLARPISAAAPA
jgi:hypothetical protein